MPAIKFLKNKNTGKLVRPQGRAFPVGLGVATSGGPTSVDYLVIAGGGGGGGPGYLGGGGAGGSGYNSPAASTGGSGIVIIRYSGSQAAGGGTYSSSGGNSIHTFTGDGTFRSNAAIFSIN